MNCPTDPICLTLLSQFIDDNIIERCGRMFASSHCVTNIQ